MRRGRPGTGQGSTRRAVSMGCASGRHAAAAGMHKPSSGAGRSGARGSAPRASHRGSSVYGDMPRFDERAAITDATAGTGPRGRSEDRIGARTILCADSPSADPAETMSGAAAAVAGNDSKGGESCLDEYRGRGRRRLDGAVISMPYTNRCRMREGARKSHTGDGIV